MSVLGLDIGGANLKASDGQGFALCRPFALWKEPQNLADAIHKLIADSPPAGLVAATMTGELADCFVTKAEGVGFIVRALQAAAGGRQVRIYLLDGSFAPPAIASAQPLKAAAANWHALARLAGRYVQGGRGLLIDIGSTTCDLIPIVDRQPASSGRTDTERLIRGELVYTGVRRSPICAVVRSLPYRCSHCPVAQELFATTLDAYLILGDLPEEPDATHTADGRAATKALARDRLARSICADREAFNEDDARQAAQWVADKQLELLRAALSRVATPLGRLGTVVISGSGEFLARRLLETVQYGSLVNLSEKLGEGVSVCAAAHAVAVLAGERTP